MRTVDQLIGVFAFAPALTVAVVASAARGPSAGLTFLGVVAAVGTVGFAVSGWRQRPSVSRSLTLTLVASFVAFGVSLLALGYSVWLAATDMSALNQTVVLQMVLFASGFTAIVLLLIARALEIRSRGDAN